ncbi:MAG: 1-acyl-sn-glycerol-3-phosphate acyltransferase [Tannerella sp.]|nr:1-acyl-sn-glycerol-3-phosphate acyltransferase [Tannerella sp.]
MKRKICKWLLRRMGWTIGPSGANMSKCVICVAPHTSNIDFIVGQLFYASTGRQAHFLIKKEWFFPPLSFIFKSMGGIPINRKKNTSKTEQLAKEFARRDAFRLVVTPEGTREKVNEWRKGFYYIALKAQVPIQIAYIDYGTKEVGVGMTFYPTGNADKDIRAIRSCYQGMQGRHQEKFGKLEYGKLSRYGY